MFHRLRSNPFIDTVPPPVIDGRTFTGTWTLVGSGRLGIPKPSSDIDYMLLIDDVDDLSTFQEWKEAPGVFWRYISHVNGRPATVYAVPRYVYDRVDASYRQAIARFTEDELRRMKDTIPYDEFYKTIGVMYTVDAVKRNPSLRLPRINPGAWQPPFKTRTP